jgi:hypothetical protein
MTGVGSSDHPSFLEETARYGTKAVALGWKSKIEAAGDNVECITVLKNIIRLFSTLADVYKDKNPFAVRLKSPGLALGSCRSTTELRPRSRQDR